MTPRVPSTAIKYRGYTLYLSEHLGTVEGRAVLVSLPQPAVEVHPLDVITVRKECWREDADLTAAVESVKRCLCDEVDAQLATGQQIRDALAEAIKDAVAVHGDAVEQLFTWSMAQHTFDRLKNWDLNPNPRWEGAKLMGIPVVQDSWLPNRVLSLRGPPSPGHPAFERHVLAARQAS